MPNNPARHRRDFVKIPAAGVRARRRDVVANVNVINRAFISARQELGAGNGTPSPTYAGGASTTSASGSLE